MTIPPFPDPFLDRPLQRRSRECQVVEMWIRAALSLQGRERIAALRDIAEMVGVTYAMIQGQVSAIKARKHAALTKAANSQRRQPQEMRRAA